VSDAFGVECVRTEGTFTLDGQSWDVTNNVWILGDADRVVVIDAAHDPAAIAEAVGDRRALMIVCTHGHSDHIDAAPELARRLHAPVAIHPDDLALWQELHPQRYPDLALADGQVIEFAGRHLEVLHTPGHTPGGVCLWASHQSEVWSGDTLFAGGPGATGRRLSSFPTIIDSIRTRLLTLPEATVVHPGHGEDTTIGAEAPQLEDWIARGH
jgi:glyoxylase-like metal-dependent hydrolase (beta-lactamase superfamily II)